MAHHVRSFWISDPKSSAITMRSSSSDAGESVTEFSVLSLNAAWACVNLIAGTIGSLPLMVYRTDGGGHRTPANDHALYRLLHDQPNFDQTALDFWEFQQASLELWGNAYARKVIGSMGQLVALVPIMPAAMSVRRLASGAIEYRWSDNGRSYTANDTEIFHIRGFGGNPLGGMSVMTFGRNTFGRARAIERSSGSMFANGMRPSGVLTFSEFLTPENRDIAETRLVEKFIGAQNAGKPMILEGGAKWEQLTLKPEDAQMLESQKHSVDDICRMFSVQPYLIGHSGADHMGTGLEQQIIAFVTFTLRRRLRRIEMAAMQQLLTPADRAAGIIIEFNLDGLLRGDTAARYAAYASGLANGHIVINEVRKLENRAPVEGGDVPRMQIQNVPITDAVKPALPVTDEKQTGVAP
jgi:HK97 family phage portal protein